ncbi:hypothetical protein BOX15_Mlig010863g5, partial [Macrostomum lignano]
AAESGQKQLTGTLPEASENEPGLIKHEPLEPAGPAVISLIHSDESQEMMLSASRMHACATCNLRFSTASSLKCHEKVHVEKETIVCVFCGLVLNAMSQLNLHMLNEHRDVSTKEEHGSQHHCEECDRYFATARSLRHHQQIRHLKEGLIQCDVSGCDAKFNTNSCLRKHIQRVHLKLRPHACPICSKRFNDTNALTGHMRVHSGERPHECPVCNKRFSESTTLKKHKLTHTGEKPYQCTVCSKRFGQIGHLQTHKKIHTNTKEFKCDQCDQYFRTGSARRMHALRAHSTERPFRCDFCDKGFVSACKLREHRQRHIAKLGANPSSSSSSV